LYLVLPELGELPGNEILINISFEKLRRIVSTDDVLLKEVTVEIGPPNPLCRPFLFFFA